eukprot:CAMPEP_0202894212 /NCGR_PEP_ID=MMETSP1392-20130828/3661_1 /ASSEMBLY_ACC=CAM_ASM_000868 /TAXON_ID=225041 /ORGANISM="Chlamydomonas chlamydogama, Strain SAG 11-48b" /LENGTH=448 /DNA_ID=CAMNT_0049578833 /DNA_START=220 /DNA_END=1566 /DNA_ORIENTATION=-
MTASTSAEPNFVKPSLPGLRGSAPLNKDVLTFADEEQAPPDAAEIENIYATAEQERLTRSSVLRDVLNISHVLTDGATAMVDDSFLRCFTSAPADRWNFNFYLFPAWCLGVVFRHTLLFPLRMIFLLAGNLVFILMFMAVSTLMPPSARKQNIERKLVQVLCWIFLMSWGAVIRYHGPRPVPAPNRIWVSNHTSMIDYPIVCAYQPFAVIMQLHSGWIRFLQTRILASLGCLWFNRTDMNDRHVVAQRMKAHVSAPDSIPLLIFPEGTCVNNEYTVLFKRGAFDMHCTVCPVAIKYNKIFVDAFWNSKRVSFGKYLLRLMTSWSVVCDVWFLEPQNIRPGESPDEFASRVQKMIADKAKLRIVPWDGYLKYYNLGQKNPGLIEKRRKVYADLIKKYLPPPAGVVRAESTKAATAGKLAAAAAAVIAPAASAEKVTGAAGSAAEVKKDK